MLKEIYLNVLEKEIIKLKYDRDFAVNLLADLADIAANEGSKINYLSKSTITQWEPEVLKLDMRVKNMQAEFENLVPTRDRYRVQSDDNRHYVFDRVYQEPIFRGSSDACNKLIDGLVILQGERNGKN